MRNQFKIFSSILAFSLLSGVVFVPFYTEASILSSLLGNEASADILDTLSSGQVSKNSQNMDLLQANVSSIPILEDKKDELILLARDVYQRIHREKLNFSALN